MITRLEPFVLSYSSPGSPGATNPGVRRGALGVIVDRARSTRRERRACMSLRVVRPLALAAMVGGALYVVAGVVQLASPEQADPFSRTSDYFIQILLVLSL